MIVTERGGPRCRLICWSGLELHNFLLAQRPVLAGGQQAVEHQGADAFAVQAHDLVVEEAKHAFDLMITALNDAQAGTARAKQFQPGGLRGQVFKSEIDALTKFADIRVGNFLLGLDVIHLGHLGLGLSDMTRPLAVIGNQHQPAGVEVQPTCDMQVVFVRLIQQVDHRRMFRILGGAYTSGWLVQHEVTRRFACLQDLPVELNLAECPDFVTWIADNLPINLDALLYQEQAYLLAVELGAVAQKTV